MASSILVSEVAEPQEVLIAATNGQPNGVTENHSGGTEEHLNGVTDAHTNGDEVTSYHTNGSRTTSSPPPLKSSSVENFRRLRVVVIGAGFSGIYLGIRIPEWLRNVDLCIYEKNDGLGGTWWEVSEPFKSVSGLARLRLLLITTDKDRQRISTQVVRATFPRTRTCIRSRQTGTGAVSTHRQERSRRIWNQQRGNIARIDLLSAGIE